MRSILNTQIKSGLLALFLAASFVMANVSSVSAFDETFYSGNNIIFYNPDSPACNPNTDIIAVEDRELAGSENLERIFGYMVCKGITDFQAAGIVGNISQE